MRTHKKHERGEGKRCSCRRDCSVMHMLGMTNDESACDLGVILHSHDGDMVHETLLCWNQHDAHA